MRPIALLPPLLLAGGALAGASPRNVVVALTPADPVRVAQPPATPVPVLELAARLGLRVRGRLDQGLGLTPVAAPRADTGPLEGRATPVRLDPARVVVLEAGDSVRAAAAVESLARAPGVAWAEVEQWREPAVLSMTAAPSRVDTRFAGSPTDPLFADTRQWGLWNAGPDGVYGGRAGADIHARAAWALSTGGAGVRLALADTGVDPSHPELAGTLPDGSPRIAFALDVTVDALPVMADSFGHGTLVAGVMAARTGEGPHFDSLGVAGVCGGDGAANPGCVLVPIRITRGHTGGAASTDIARALLYAAEVGARAVNLSFASPWPSRIERLALTEALARGTVVVCAAGNRGYERGTAAQYPAAYAEDGLCVQAGASDPWDAPAVFSSHGPGLDLLAPGVDVWTTFMTYPSAAGAAYDGYVAASGTSFAAPFVTGTIGLLCAARPELAADDLQPLLRAGADDLGEPGADALTGAGRLDAARALELVGPDRVLVHRTVAADTWRLAGTDTLTLGETGVALLDRLGRRALAQRWELSATLAVPDSIGDSIAVWPRMSAISTVRDRFVLPWLAPWAAVDRSGARTLRVRGSLYRLVDARLDDTTLVRPIERADSAALWIPVPPGRATFAVTLLGRRAVTRTVPPRSRPAIALAPNPARGGTVQLAGAAGERVEVHDLAGRRIARIALSPSGAGTWDGRDAHGRVTSSGLYFVHAPGRPEARLVWLRGN